MIDLRNRVALISGGSRGIGAATAELFAEAGAAVIITYSRNRTAAAALLRRIVTRGQQCMAISAKVEDFRACRRVVSSVLRKFGRIDILVNTAGIWEYGKIGAMTPAEWKKTIDINLTGTFNMCNAVIPHMKERRYGRIINVSSTAGQRGEPFHSHYAASKGGVIAFTKSIAPELIRRGIWVNCVAPGWVDTQMVAHVFSHPARKREILQTIPRGRIATPREIAGPILFLATSLSDNVVGEILNVNGGSVLCG